MKYRTLPRGGERVSEIGLGLAKIHEAGEDGVRAALKTALGAGINFFDLCCTEKNVYRLFTETVGEKRGEVFTQMHLGCAYPEGQYAHIHDKDEIIAAFEDTLAFSGDTYADCGMFHCVDEEAEFESIVAANGLLNYALGLKKQGVLRHVGVSTHTPAVARKFMDTDEIDLIMFSVNPAYDYTKGDWAGGSHEERLALYNEAERRGVALSVMKPFAGGQLLDSDRSPLNVTLSRFQCLRYALDRPAVVTCLPGVTGEADVKALLGFEDADPADTDYSVMAKAAPAEAQGRCVYCNHCAPCPAGIDIGLVNKYYDLAVAGDGLAAEHYKKLSLKADDCESCGHCDDHCPFGVDQSGRMEEIAAWFAGR